MSQLVDWNISVRCKRSYGPKKGAKIWRTLFTTWRKVKVCEVVEVEVSSEIFFAKSHFKLPTLWENVTSDKRITRRCKVVVWWTMNLCIWFPRPPANGTPNGGRGGSWDAVNVHRKRNVTGIVWPKNVCKTASYESKACLPPRIVPASYSVHFSETPVLGMVKRKMQMLFSL